MLKFKIADFILAAIFFISCQGDTLISSDSGDFRGTYHAAVTYANLSDSTIPVGGGFGAILSCMEAIGWG